MAGDASEAQQRGPSIESCNWVHLPLLGGTKERCCWVLAWRSRGGSSLGTAEAGGGGAMEKGRLMPACPRRRKGHGGACCLLVPCARRKRGLEMGCWC
ncbi:hypothetical protein U9M48_023746 [Paspalum notatum var. saurae]|uniref:Uncharacterized protein n=1 Tax=Paspalum notatum var. saurae TaxID=547442 RepID=A0AAQ3WWE6_PASNO